MKIQLQNIICFLALLLVVVGCGNNEDDPNPVDCTSNPIMVSLNMTEENCGLSDGVIEVIASGGQGDLFYSNDGGATFQADGIFSNLISGTFAIVVKDENDCEKISNVILENTGGVTILIDSQLDATCGSNSGEIVAVAPVSSNVVEFKLDDGMLQSAGTFSGLAPGNYTVHAVEIGTDCESTIDVLISSGISFVSSIQNIITTKCAISGCHVSGTGRQDFTSLSTIQSNASAIKSRTQSGNMPATGSITQEQKDLIACWVDDGALNN